jgi:hypothetical protein
MVAELIRFERILHAVDYPIAQEELVNFAMENGADEEIIQALQSLPNHSYATPNDVFEALSKVRKQDGALELAPIS